MKGVWVGLGAAAMVATVWGAGARQVMAGADDEAAKPEFYRTKVQPIFQANCYRCHGGMNHRGGLTLSTKAGIVKGGKDGAILVPGDPSASLLVKLIRQESPGAEPPPMPPKGKLSDADIAIVERWVRAGAVMPDDAPSQ
jgi:mono/diheme cytochrome c family protein